MSRILVTGGAGFIGSHLCESLLRDGHQVVALDNFDDFYPASIKESNIEGLLPSRFFTLTRGDIRQVDTVAGVFAEKFDVVVHLAARAGVRPSIEQPLVYQDVNVHGTLVLLEALRKQPRCKFIFGSSSSIYGNNAKVPFSEDDRVEDPISPYAATKRAGELFCRTYHHLYGHPVTCLRFFTVYGPRQRPDLAIHKFVKLIDNRQPIPVFGDGSMMRDFTYVDDIVAGIRLAIEACNGFNIYNLGRSQPITLADLIDAIEAALGKKAIIDRRPLQPGDVDHTYADVSKAQRELGYAPKVDIHTGLARFVQWHREQQKPSHR